MKKLILVAVMTTLSACAPKNTEPSAGPPTGLCTAAPCVVLTKDNVVVPAETFYSKYESKVVGTCADMASMGFNTMVANSVLTKDLDGFAQVRLDLDPAGTYTGLYVSAAGPFGPANPSAQVPRTATRVSGKWRLGNDKMVIEDFGIGRRNLTDDDLIFVPMSTGKLDFSTTSLVSFTHETSRISADGKTVEQYCADQAAKK